MSGRKGKLAVAVVGLGFGGEFATIYRDHPEVDRVILCDQDERRLNDYGDAFGFADRRTDFRELLSDQEIDAIHIVTNIHSHAQLAIQALRAGKHCASTVPMATTLAELEQLVRVQESCGRNYMMMETSVLTSQCLYAKSLIDQGKVGNIQYLRGTHFQDMEGWPDYWMGLPPMHYSTHALAPLLYLSGHRAAKVHCFGSGTMRKELVEKYGNPYPVEMAIFQLEDGFLAAEVARSLFHTAREYVEGFSIYGDQMSMEWNLENEMPYLFEFLPNPEMRRGRDIKTSHTILTDFSGLLPEPIRKYTSTHTILDSKNPHLSIQQGGGHHGSHPHLVHEFIRSIIEERAPMIDARTAANWTAAGICAHESAMRNGEVIDIPKFNSDKRG